ncbi:MAG: CehA/McbA family metallohydrolase [Polyangiaceae bacterium]
MRSRALLPWCALGSALAIGLSPQVAAADQTLTFDGTVEDGKYDHELLEFDVPEGVAEIQFDHENLSGEGVLDWGLLDPDGFRGWGGGNSESAIVSEKAASRSYLAGPIQPGKWHIVIGKALLLLGYADYHVTITLRDAATLAPQPERRKYEAIAPLATGPRFYAGDLHAHSRESGDAAPEIEDLVTFARSQGLDFVELSDHNTVSQLDFIGSVQDSHDDILILPGVEFTTYAGHANGIGATEWVDHKIGQPGVTIIGAEQAFHDQGALFSINHPEYNLGDKCIGCGWGHNLVGTKIDAIEVATAGAGELFADSTLAWWDGLCDAGNHVAPVGGSDDHTAGQDEGSFSTPVGTPTTYVYAQDLSVASLLQGIRDSRTVVKLHGVTDPMVELTTDLPLDHDTVHGEQVHLHAKVTGAAGMEASWFKNGEDLGTIALASDPAELSLVVDAPKNGTDRYRVQVYRDGKVTTITGHVWVDYLEGVGETPGSGSTMPGAGPCACELAGAAPDLPGKWAGPAAWLFAMGLLTRRRAARDRR